MMINSLVIERKDFLQEHRDWYCSCHHYCWRSGPWQRSMVKSTYMCVSPHTNTFDIGHPDTSHREDPRPTQTWRSVPTNIFVHTKYFYSQMGSNIFCSCLQLLINTLLGQDSVIKVIIWWCPDNVIHQWTVSMTRKLEQSVEPCR